MELKSEPQKQFEFKTILLQITANEFNKELPVVKVFLIILLETPESH